AEFLALRLQPGVLALALLRLLCRLLIHLGEPVGFLLDLRQVGRKPRDVSPDAIERVADPELDPGFRRAERMTRSEQRRGGHPGGCKSCFSLVPHGAILRRLPLPQTTSAKAACRVGKGGREVHVMRRAVPTRSALQRGHGASATIHHTKARAAFAHPTKITALQASPRTTPWSCDRPPTDSTRASPRSSVCLPRTARRRASRWS